MKRSTIAILSAGITASALAWLVAYVHYEASYESPPPTYRSTAILRVDGGAASTVRPFVRGNWTVTVQDGGTLLVHTKSDATGSGEAEIADWVDQFPERVWPDHVEIASMSTAPVHRSVTPEPFSLALITTIASVLLVPLAISIANNEPPPVLQCPSCGAEVH